MRYMPEVLRGMLLSMVRKLGESPECFARNPGKDFTRRRTLTFETIIFLLLTMSEKSIGKALMRHFHYKPDTPSVSAIVQQRQKLMPEAMETLFHHFTE